MKRIPNYPGYMADTTGGIFSFFQCIRNKDGTIKDRVVDYSKKPKLLSTQFKKEKDRSQIRPHVILRVRGKRVKVLVSRLVALAHLPNPKKYPCVRHLDDISDNNSVKNLAWGTNENNIADRKRNQLNDVTIKSLQAELKRYKQKYGELQ